MASFNPQDHGFGPQDYGFGFDDPPPRPNTPPVRRGFLVVLFFLSVAALLVYGVPHLAERIGHAWEAGRARAATEALTKLEKAGIPNQASMLFRLAVTAVSPAVVNVQSQRLRQRLEGVPGLPLGGNLGGPDVQGRELGSGVIIDKAKGYVVTNHHVIKDADRILVRLGPGEDVPARLVGADPKSDLAVLQVRGPLAAQAQWGDSDQLDIGDWVLAIGSPLGFDHSVTAGIISATERNGIRIADYESFIQTDAAINPGNSGGPLISLTGKVVGINTAIITQSGGYEGIGLSIPSSLARRVVEGLIKDGKVIRGYLGVIIEPLDAETSRKLKLPNNHGARVARVQPGSPAAASGLKRGDVIVRLAERDIADPAELRLLTANQDVGAQVPLVFYRNGAAQTVKVTIAELPDAPETGYLGFHVREVPSGEGKSAVEVDSVLPGSPAARAGLRSGSKILAVGRLGIRSMTEFEAAIRQINPETGLPLVVLPPGGNRPLLVPIGGRFHGASPAEPENDPELDQNSP
ncbi:MAG: trypsin-like peptidase domain-containing protein [Planctomycetaceae bacterium]|nr:trypsin-like peptidase domain-containing protein [Planctomycetaceae bacterium]